MANSLARELADLLPQVLAALTVDDPRLGLDPALRFALELGLMRAVEPEEREQIQERYEMLSAASFEGIMINADGGVVIEANQRLAELTGDEPAELTGSETMLRCVAPEDLPAVLNRMREGCASRTAPKPDVGQRASACTAVKPVLAG